VGTVTGIMAMSAKSTLDRECPHQMCRNDAWSDLDRASTLGTVSTLSFGAAIVGAVVAIYSLTHSSSSSAASSSSSSSSPVRVTPVLGLGSASLHASF
jgi:hypothetical protein